MVKGVNADNWTFCAQKLAKVEQNFIKNK